MKNRIIALSFMLFGFSALVQARGLVLINDMEDANLTYTTGGGSGTVHSKKNGGGYKHYQVFPRTPSILSIKRSTDYFPRPLETYLLKLHGEKKTMDNTNVNNPVVGVLTINSDSITAKAMYLSQVMQLVKE